MTLIHFVSIISNKSHSFLRCFRPAANRQHFFLIEHLLFNSVFCFWLLVSEFYPNERYIWFNLQSTNFGKFGGHLVTLVLFLFNLGWLLTDCPNVISTSRLTLPCMNFHQCCFYVAFEYKISKLISSATKIVFK